MCLSVIVKADNEESLGHWGYRAMKKGNEKMFEIRKFLKYVKIYVPVVLATYIYK